MSHHQTSSQHAPQRISTVIRPTGSMNILSAQEVTTLQDSSQTGLHQLFRACALAVLNCQSASDDAEELLSEFKDFEIKILQEHRGLKLQLDNAPVHGFVDGKLIKGVQENLFSVLRDILYVHSYHLADSLESDSTNRIFQILRHAQAYQAGQLPSLVVCWGGHAISQQEYAYTKQTGYRLGLRGLDICTGCGPGAMKGPMKGAYIAHAKQRIPQSRFIGLTEPGIIASESPNPIVNQLIIMPDIEKRLEAFIRLGHGVIVFPGGAGTAEEILYLLGVLLHPDNADIPFPLVFTGPACAAAYFDHIDAFIGKTLGKVAQDRYQIIIDDPEHVAKTMHAGLQQVTEFRKKTRDAYYFNWQLTIDPTFQTPFAATHDAMASLQLSLQQPADQLASQLRCAMSGIVAGNVKPDGVDRIRRNGPFQLQGDATLMQAMDELLQSFIQQGRMKLSSSDYVPCYRIQPA